MIAGVGERGYRGERPRYVFMRTIEGSFADPDDLGTHKRRLLGDHSGLDKRHQREWFDRRSGRSRTPGSDVHSVRRKDLTGLYIQDDGGALPLVHDFVDGTFEVG